MLAAKEMNIDERFCEEMVVNLVKAKILMAEGMKNSLKIIIKP